MLYLKGFHFPTKIQEDNFLYPKDKTPEEIIKDVYKDYRPLTHEGSFYPFDTLSRNNLSNLVFSDKITILCGGNGCGKTTALNVIAEKIGLKRDSLFNTGRFFQDYLNMCGYTSASNSDTVARYKSKKETGIDFPVDSRIIVSDDVFAHSMKKRQINSRQEDQRYRMERTYNDLVYSTPNLKSMEDFERWNARNQALKSKSRFMKEHLEEELHEHSNGETAMLYFIERMENPGLYLLDEPENSLSWENQIKLAEYIESSARFFDYQFIISSHSPVFLSMKGAKIYDLDANPVEMKKWTELENVRTLFNFFKAHENEFELSLF